MAQAEALTQLFSDAEKAYCLANFSWPQSIVKTDTGDFIGVLIGDAGDLFSVKLVSGAASVRSLDFLLYPLRARYAGIEPLPIEAKLRIITNLATAFSFLNDHGMVYEDFSPRNILWAPSSEVFVIDCDSISVPSEKHRPPASFTPGWIEPRLLRGKAEHADEYTMTYCLGLLLARVLLADANWTEESTSGLERLNAYAPELRRLVERALQSTALRIRVSEFARELAEAALSVNLNQAHAAHDSTVAFPSRSGAKQSLSYSLREKLALLLGTAAGSVIAMVLLLKLFYR